MKQAFSFYKEGRINKKIKQTSLVTLSNQFINKCTEISNILKGTSRKTGDEIVS